MRERKAPSKAIRLWGGYTNGELSMWRDDYGDGPMTRVAVYPSRRLAREHYEDVRRIEIREVRR